MRQVSISLSVLLLLARLPHCRAAEPGHEPIVVRVDASKIIGPISPLVYGINGNDYSKRPYIPFTRQGGNRMTAWNWETNASNAGNDWQHQNDSYLGGGDKVGEVARSFLAPAMERGQTAILTIPMAGYVAADKKGGGDVNKTPDYLSQRFFKSLPKKNGPFSDPPDLADKVVYQDEFVWWINKQFPASARHGGQIFYSLDNEPDLWSSTHARIHPKPATYAEMIEKTCDLAGAIKDVERNAVVFGFVSYGYAGYMHLQNAPDAKGRDFIDFFLSSMQEVEKQQHRRLLDVLDLHWYTEVYASKKRVTEPTTDPASVQARVQAPRSLWDPTYRENSWIDRDVLRQPIRLIPRIKEKIAKNYPGTKLALTEYHYGADKHISGAIAQADALGIFGREGVFAASIWGGGPFTFAAFDCFVNYDGKGSGFGDLALDCTSSRIADISAYAASFKTDRRKLTLVLINRSEQSRRCKLDVKGFAFKTATLYRVCADAPQVKQAVSLQVAPGEIIELPSMTVTTAVLK